MARGTRGREPGEARRADTPPRLTRRGREQENGRVTAAMKKRKLGDSSEGVPAGW